MDCFACDASAAAEPETPWSWRQPRLLCPGHSSTVRLEDGQCLRDVLAGLEPPDQRLEGGMLAWIFNPVFVDGPGRPNLRGWTDFAGGGMGVFEDVAGAHDYFEAVAFIHPAALDALYALRLTAEARDVGEGLSFLFAAYQAVPKDERRYVSHLYGADAGFRILRRTSGHQAELRAIRAAHGRLWPASYSDLMDWIDRLFAAGNRSEAETGLEWIPNLLDLARRRFPRGRSTP